MEKIDETCLAGWQCPTCEERTPFLVQTVSVATVDDDGIDSHTDTEWKWDSYVTCGSCEHFGIVAEFCHNRANGLPTTFSGKIKFAIEEAWHPFIHIRTAMRRRDKCLKGKSNG